MATVFKLLLIFSLLSVFSCTRVLYTHEQVLDRYKTRNDVQKAFDIPTERLANDTSEQWLYQYDKRVKPHHNIQTATVTNFGKYNRYLLFSFDRSGNVVQWYYDGVDLTVRKSNPLGTVGLVAGGVGLVILTYVALGGVSFGSMSLNGLTF